MASPLDAIRGAPLNHLAATIAAAGHVVDEELWDVIEAACAACAGCGDSTHPSTLHAASAAAAAIAAGAKPREVLALAAAKLHDPAGVPSACLAVFLIELMGAAVARQPRWKAPPLPPSTLQRLVEVSSNPTISGDALWVAAVSIALVVRLSPLYPAPGGPPGLIALILAALSTARIHLLMRAGPWARPAHRAAAATLLRVGHAALRDVFRLNASCLLTSWHAASQRGHYGQLTGCVCSSGGSSSSSSSSSSTLARQEGSSHQQ